MIVERILGNIHTEHREGAVICVPFAWFEVGKKRIKKVAQDGTEFGVMVEAVLKDGDILAVQDEGIYVCEIVPSELTKIQVRTMQEMGRLCFELGNRHLSLKIEEHFVLVPYDKPTFLYLEKLGFQVEHVQEKFSDFTECKAHGSSEKNHGHSHADSADNSNHAHGHTHRH